MGYNYIGIALICLAAFIVVPADTIEVPSVNFYDVRRCVALINERAYDVYSPEDSPEKAKAKLESLKNDPTLLKDENNGCLEMLRGTTEITDKHCVGEFLLYLQALYQGGFREDYMQEYLFSFWSKQRDACRHAFGVRMDALWSKLSKDARDQMDRLGQSLIGDSASLHPNREASGPEGIEIIVDSMREAGYEDDKVFTIQVYNTHMRALVEAIKAHKEESRGLLEFSRWRSKTADQMKTTDMRLEIIRSVLSIIDGSFYEPRTAQRQFIEADMEWILPKAALNKQLVASLDDKEVVRRVIGGLVDRYRVVIKEREYSPEQKEFAVFRVIHGPCQKNWLRFEAENLFKEVGLYTADERASARLDNLRALCKIVNSTDWKDIWEKVVKKASFSGKMSGLIDKLKIDCTNPECKL